MTADVVAQLYPPRLPESFTALSLFDLVAAFGAGLVLATLVLTIAGPMLRRRPRPPRTAERVAATRTLPAEERLLALTRLLAEAGGTLPDDQRAALYAGGPGAPDRIEAMIPNAGRRQ